MLVVADASPLILLDRVGRLSLLPALFHQIVVPPAVLDEISAGAEEGTVLAALATEEWVEVGRSPADSGLLTALMDELGAGEASAIALACSSRADLVLIDERQGRRIARRLGLVVKGTLGVLVEARRRELVADLRTILESLREGGAWLSDSLVREALRAVGEDDS